MSFDIPKNEKFDKIISKYEIPNVENKIDVQNLKSKLKDLMWNNVGIYRNEKSLNDAINGLNELEKEFPKQDKYLSKEEYEFKNMLISARLIVKSAIRRKESRGAHYRTDYLETNEVCEHSILSRRKGELSFAK